MTTATQVHQRIEQRFKLYDKNNNGAIERDDLEAEANRIIKAFGEAENTPKASALKEAYSGLWEYMSQQTGAGPDGAITLEQFEQFSQRNIVAQGDAGFARVLRPTIEAIVNLVDTDGDGQVNPPEFKRWLKAIGVDASSADEAFALLDVNGNGQLDTDELVKAVRDYHAGKLDVPLLGSPH
ncbi:signal transduction protein [Amycolatopsis sp. WAC 01376]|uniref:EF-hand domain-containing protein n=1 Tax=Amycolatopsis sp. WAC 01376 TaxID=2203195 RepID=UPI000F7AE973|nr:EF-hand domain-containing protein [Amycolatopsis sp. WAC 01376]RSM55163.1 signal transduction protein [Amycolatopsis sp. WAC 01376]